MGTDHGYIYAIHHYQPGPWARQNSNL